MAHPANIISLPKRDVRLWRRSEPNGKASNAPSGASLGTRMNRSTFLSQLRAGLTGLPQQDADEIVKDYDSHFADGAAEGRSEEEIAAALGDPARLAKELRAEFNLKRLERKGGALNVVAALLALGGLATLDIFLLFPVALVVCALLLVVGLALLIVAAIGAIEFLSVSWNAFAGTGDVLARMLGGIGLLAAATSGTAFLLIALGAAVRALGGYARLHYRLLRRTEPLGEQP
jgi:uncharacterized membrane protein